MFEEIDLQQLPVGNHRIPCPKCMKGKRDTALSVTIDSKGAEWQCFRCRWKGAQQHQERARRVSAAAPRVSQHISLASHYRYFWSTLASVSGTAAEYLTARGCPLPPKDGDLCSTETLKHPSGYMGAALVALVTDAETSEPLTLHHTWIKSDGTKANVDTPRLLLGKHRKAGGVIRLWPDAAVTTGLAIAEGIETALTAALAFKPVWSVIDAGNMGAFPVRDGIESLLIIADNDPAGLQASEQCAERWYRAGREVRIVKSPVPGEDLNDYARRVA